MKEELDKEKLLNEAIPEEVQSREEVIRYMVDNRFVSNTLLRDLQIHYLYKKERRCEKAHGAVLNVSVKRDISERTVYRIRKKFERR